MLNFLLKGMVVRGQQGVERAELRDWVKPINVDDSNHKHNHTTLLVCG